MSMCFVYIRFGYINYKYCYGFYGCIANIEFDNDIIITTVIKRKQI